MMTKFKLLMLVGLVLFLTAGPVPAASDSSIKGLKASYLQSIHDDCKTFLEGIELFIRRDYPTFWNDMENSASIDRNDIHKYIKELNHFEEMLDALYNEFISFRTAHDTQQTSAYATLNIDELQRQKHLDLEKQIFQMLSYSYMRTGDFSMAKALMEKGDIHSKNYVIQIRDIEGVLRNFPLTEKMNQLFETISSNLTILKIKLKYFLPSDIQRLNAYIKISDYDRENPFNQIYLDFYSGKFPGLKAADENVIHFGEIINYYNRLKYINLFNNKKPDFQDPHTISYEFPILKGSYSLVVNDANVFIPDPTDSNVLTMEHLCMFKGFVRTDFRQLKWEEKQHMKAEKIIDKNLSLEKISQQKILSQSLLKELNTIRPGERLRYGTYKLYEKGIYLGPIELVPSIVGSNIKKKNPDKSMTEIKVFDHELTFFKDILDLVQSNYNTYGKMMEKSEEKPKKKKKSKKFFLLGD